jgi:hypothetical protein
MTKCCKGVMVGGDYESGQLTQLIQRAAGGDRSAEADFCELVYDELREEARRVKGRGNRGSVDSTDLVNNGHPDSRHESECRPNSTAVAEENTQLNGEVS